MEEVEGDLEEIFKRATARRGPRAARFIYWKEVVLFCLWHGLSRMGEHDLTWNTGMFKNYLTVAWRNLRRHKGYALINVSGLALGMACCILILMLVRHEFSYDSFHEHADSVYRVYIEGTRPTGEVETANLIPPPIGEALAQAYPGVLAYSNYVGGQPDLKHEDRVFPERLYMVDPGFFDVFTFPFLAGDPARAVATPSGIVLTEETARNFFGNVSLDDILGQSISMPRGDSAFVFTVTGILAPLPSNSSLQFDALVSFKNYDQLGLGANDNGGRTSLYLRLKDDDDPAAFEHALAPFTALQFADRIEEAQQASYIAKTPDAFRLRLQPLRDLHLNPKLNVNYEEPPHNPLYSYVLSGIALLVLLIACINFMMLSIGRSTTRAKEVGMRQALGARRSQIMKQFWGEAILMSLVALVLGILLASLLLPLFNQLTGRELSLSAFVDRGSLLALLGLIAIVGLVAGGYPAAVLSGFHPVAVLKGDVKSRDNRFFTRSLIVVQYTLSIALIVSTVVMAQQLHFMLNRDLGFRGDQVVVLHTYSVTDKEAPGVIEQFRHALLPDSRIVKIARAGYSFTRGGDWNGWLDAEGNQREAANFGIDYDYLDVMGMQLVAGRNFSREHPSDPTGAILVNEALVRQFDIKDPIGYKLTGWNSWYVKEPPTIIGVVKDFNFRSLHEEVRPAVLNMQPDYYVGMGAMLVKISENDIPGTIGLLEKTWSEILPGRPFSYSFLNDDMAAQYQTEQRWSKILTYSSLLAILIACMGLFGLATLSTVRRTKEIGIRKVLGASVSGIVTLVSKEFVLLVLFSGVAAAPLAYYAMHRWLDMFAYRIPLGPGAFILAALTALLIALATVSYQSVKAALADPVKSLRYE